MSSRKDNHRNKHRDGIGRENNQGNSNDAHGHDINLSKSLSYLLRHGAPKENITVHSGGFIDVDDILKQPKFSRWTEDNIRKVVEDNDKQRFSLRTEHETGKLQICANQGHSFDVGDGELEPISSPENYDTVIHGTYTKCWHLIKASGLRRMNRVHIHFAPGEPGETGVISGMRKSADIYIYVDIAKALNDGIKFYRSKNNVVLCPGNEDGILETKYFLKVVNVKTKDVLSV